MSALPGGAHVGAEGWAFLGFACVLVPYLSIRGARRLESSGIVPSRRAHLISVFVTQALLLGLALFTARREGVTLFPRPTFSLPAALGAAALVAATLATLPSRWRRRTRDEKRRLLFMLPARTRDLSWWLAVSLVAGFVEEVTYRGVLFALLLRLFGAWWPAVLACVVAFALAHWVQGARTALVIAVVSIGVHAVVRMTGDLYTAMALHATYDLLAGIVLLTLARRDGLLPAG